MSGGLRWSTPKGTPLCAPAPPNVSCVIVRRTRCLVGIWVWRCGRKGVTLIRETSHRIEMLSISPRVKKILFTVLWVLQAVVCFRIPAFGKLPYVLAGFIVLLLVLLWVFPGHVALRRIIIDVFILLSLAFLAMFILLALFFGKHHELFFALLGVDILIILASCWLIKP